MFLFDFCKRKKTTKCAAPRSYPGYHIQVGRFVNCKGKNHDRQALAALIGLPSQENSPMTIEVFASELKRFLSTEDPEVLCITGRWGVGKTYAWRHYLKEAQKAKSVALSKYSYVSLFGRNSLDDVRTSIVEKYS